MSKELLEVIDGEAGELIKISAALCLAGEYARAGTYFIKSFKSSTFPCDAAESVTVLTELIDHQVLASGADLAESYHEAISSMLITAESPEIVNINMSNMGRKIYTTLWNVCRKEECKCEDTHYTGDDLEQLPDDDKSVILDLIEWILDHVEIDRYQCAELLITKERLRE